MATVTVRVNEKSHKTLLELAKQQNASMADVLDDAIEQYRRRKFLEDLNTDFAALRLNADEWRHEEEERAAWETTLGDGSLEIK